MGVLELVPGPVTWGSPKKSVLPSDLACTGLQMTSGPAQALVLRLTRSGHRGACILSHPLRGQKS